MAKKKAAKKKITREVVCTYCTPYPGAGVSEKPASESVALQGADFTLPFTAHAEECGIIKRGASYVLTLEEA